ncbi:MAG: molybdenum cofactor cytidylyltransferase [Dehalococcoidales bacterium]|nr:molybdenum cofactor cytidylyltransferase [Dehalococcoidales bacterium]
MISAILLAAGESKRMGQPKQLLPLGDKTLVEHALDNLLASRVDEVIVVTGNQAETIAKKVGKRPVKVVLNPDYRLGMSTSLKTGLASIDKDAEAVMVVLADQPFIDAALINRLIDEFTCRNKGIVVPVFKGKRGHPIIFATKYRDELLQLRGDAGAKVLLQSHPDDVLEVAVASGHIHVDIDDMDSYELQKKKLKKRTNQ